MNCHEAVYDTVRKFRQPVTAPVLQSEMTPKLSYALLTSCLNDLVRNGKLTESKNEVGKRVFEIK